MNIPIISVIMPVYNEEAYVTAAIRSILNQSYSNFELLIFNDGSTDRSFEMIKNFNDPRIRIFDYKLNQGYVVHLNRGILESKGKYIARMDADDIAIPDRFEQQVQFLEANPEITILGGWYRNFGSRLIQKYPLNHEEIKTTMLTSCPMVHPTIMMRKTSILKHQLFYHPDYLYSEDFELWSRAIQKLKFANLPKVLIERRIHGSNVSVLYHKRQRRQSASVRKFWMQKLIGKETSLQASAFLERALNFQTSDSLEIRRLIQVIITANKREKVFQSELLAAQLEYVYLLNGIKNICKLNKYSWKSLFRLIWSLKWTFLQKKFIRTSMKMKIKRIAFYYFKGEKTISQKPDIGDSQTVPFSSELEVDLSVSRGVI